MACGFLEIRDDETPAHLMCPVDTKFKTFIGP